MAAAEFAELLRELKDRSGLSYGTLAKRLHMSTSTLHRYCNGDAVPTDYAPVERLARLCKASTEELVELHRRWVLADAGRGRKGSGPAAAEVGDPVAAGVDTDLVGDGVPEPSVDRRRRRAVLAGIAVVAVAGAVVLGVQWSGGGGEREDGAAAASVRGKGAGSAAPAQSGSASASPSVSASASASASVSSSGTPSPSASVEERPGAAVEDSSGTPPLAVGIRPYAWESPCDQRYLIDRQPGQVSPPPVEQDAPAWVAAHGAVASGEQYLEMTVQGTGEETVVVDGLKVRTVQKRSPLAWNDYAMGYPGVGCGGGVPTRYFTVALDAARPTVVPESGHADFPFKVSESDPEVYYISADASAYDVSWTLELSWSSGSRHGTLIVDDKGRPFRTSGNNGRPAYEFPLGGSAWQRAGSSPAQ
ncbi:helix-turn-helix domain-containing protein [Streptomyces phaeoluteigriseus]|uniref:Helix-turn-helix domain-containing protein n=1 Tax=Streptomyces phaeoluteigriseus TaxID=114686 RepID=A0ABY4Z166_9ACTN|nr:helix-turn-helix transcriptional regulator [Streptomyces phaeoluteigriseus]USQ82792.1 helix-turn-helix domain-containing protein [Streptomyces phaeoluteigriseus]